MPRTFSSKYVQTSWPPRRVNPESWSCSKNGAETGRHDRVEHDVRPGRGDALDGRAVVGVIERKIFLADDRTAMGRHDLTDPLIHHVRPDVVGRGQIELLRPGLAHQPRDERVDLLRRHGAGAEEERIGFLSFILLGIDVERAALDDDRLLDGLPRRAVDAAEDDIDAVVLHELRGAGGRDDVVRLAVLEAQLDVPPEQATLGVEIADDHPGHVGIGEPHDRERARLIRDDSHLDRTAASVCAFKVRHATLPRSGARLSAACSRRSRRARGSVESRVRRDIGRTPHFEPAPPPQ